MNNTISERAQKFIDFMPADIPSDRSTYGDDYADRFALPAISEFIRQETGEVISEDRPHALRAAVKNYLLEGEGDKDHFDFDSLISSFGDISGYLPQNGEGSGNENETGQIAGLLSSFLPGADFDPWGSSNPPRQYQAPQQTSGPSTGTILAILAGIAGLVVLIIGVSKK